MTGRMSATITTKNDLNSAYNFAGKISVREATFDDKPVWDAFADAEGGNFYHYFDWKIVYEARGDRMVMLMIESDASPVGILPLIVEKRRYYSIIRSDHEVAGLLLKQDFSDSERNEAILAVLSYIDDNYTDGCSRFELKINAPESVRTSEEPVPILIESGFRFRYDKLSGLPCSYLIELKQPFEEYIWNGLWPHNLRKKIRKVMKNGVTFFHDRKLDYAGDFYKMLAETYKRHGVAPKSENEVNLILNAFRDKLKLFVALEDGQPVVMQLCFYNASTCYLADIGSYVKDTADVNVLCYMVAIEDACNAGYRYADLGRTSTAGLAAYKEQFRGIRIPIGSYEKRYSITRTLMELVPGLFNRIRHDKGFIWRRRHQLWDRIIHW